MVKDEFKKFCNSYHGCCFCPLGKNKTIYEVEAQDCEKEFEKYLKER